MNDNRLAVALRERLTTRSERMESFVFQKLSNFTFAQARPSLSGCCRLIETAHARRLQQSIATKLVW